MLKRYINCSLLYAALALAGGVFYREFTKWSQFTGRTSLAFLHTHYLILGTVFFLLLLLIEKNFPFFDKSVGKILIAYHVGLNVTAAGFLMRGWIQAWMVPLSAGLDAALSGFAGCGHILLGVSILLLLWKIKKGVHPRMVRG